MRSPSHAHQSAASTSIPWPIPRHVRSRDINTVTCVSA